MLIINIESADYGKATKCGEPSMEDLIGDFLEPSHHERESSRHGAEVGWFESYFLVYESLPPAVVVGSELVSVCVSTPAGVVVDVLLGETPLGNLVSSAVSVLVRLLQQRMLSMKLIVLELMTTAPYVKVKVELYCNAEDLKEIGEYVLLQKLPKCSPSEALRTILYPVEIDVQRLTDTLAKSANNFGDLPETEPLLVSTTLFSYQKKGLTWMIAREKPRELDETEWSYSYTRTKDIHTGLFVFESKGIGLKRFEHVPFQARGGILADDMGLGKTLQIIALIATHSGMGGPVEEKKEQSLPEPVRAPMKKKSLLPSRPGLEVQVGTSDDEFDGFDEIDDAPQAVTAEDELPARGPTLIVCPASVVDGWLDQFSIHANTLNVFAYVGTDREQKEVDFSAHDVVITSYGCLRSESERQVKGVKSGLFLLQQRWLRVVLDEAHVITNSKSLVHFAVLKLKADRRWCVTGTPVQNKRADLRALVSFLELEPYRHVSWWKHVVDPWRGVAGRTFAHEFVGVLTNLVRSVVLRRMKTTMYDGKRIVELPTRQEKVVTVVLTAEEREAYDSLAKTSDIQTMTRRRLWCDHPLLAGGSCNGEAKLEEFSQSNGELCLGCGNPLFEGVIVEGCEHLICKDCRDKMAEGGDCPICCCSKCLELQQDDPVAVCAQCALRPTDVVNVDEYERDYCDALDDVAAAPPSPKMLALLKELNTCPRGDKIVIFSQWTRFMDLLQPFLARNGFTVVRYDGSMNRAQRSQAIATFRTDAAVRVFLASIGSGGVGITLTVANHLFLLDPSWNPALEQQAVDRVYRVGQTKPVSVVRFITQGTVEQFVQQKQRDKLVMIKQTIVEW